ncbi:MAG TPA: VWA domain-containing protein, partial [Terriglobales bacterium]|nr:VWA domain-containing protein [Terriglobales bacterium]
MSIRPRHLWQGFALAVCCFLVALSVEAQAPSSGEVPAPTIRVSTHMVLVDVVVTDKQGKPVSGLHADDFVVEENGKQQKIAAFTTPAESNPAPESLPPGIYSNRAQYRSPGMPITVLLLDAINTPFKDQAYARNQMLRFAKDNLKPDQRVAVMTLTGPLNVLQDFTSDPKVLYTALQRYRPLQNQYTPASGTPPSGPAGPIDASLTPVDTGTGLGPGLSALIQSATAQLQAFSDVAGAYAVEERVIFTL